MAIIKIKLNEIHNAFDVRTQTRADEDHVLSLVDRIKAGEQLRSILITPVQSLPKDFPNERPKAGYIDIDGRHTLSAYDLLDRKEIECRVQNFKSYADMVATGMHENDSPCLPNTRKDDKDNILKLTQAGYSRDDIAKSLYNAGFSKKVAWNKVVYAFQREAKNRQKLAVKAVKLGKMTPETASEEFHVQLPALQRRVDASANYNTNKFCSNIGIMTKAFIASVGKEYRRLQENDLTPQEEAKVNALIKDLQWRIGRGLAGLVVS